MIRDVTNIQHYSVFSPFAKYSVSRILNSSWPNIVGCLDKYVQYQSNTFIFLFMQCISQIQTEYFLIHAAWSYFSSLTLSWSSLWIHSLSSRFPYNISIIYSNVILLIYWIFNTLNKRSILSSITIIFVISFFHIMLKEFSFF